MATKELILFDLDGVVCDTEIIVYTIFAEKLRRFGIQCSAKSVCQKYFGKSYLDIRREFFREYSLRLPEKFFETIQQQVTERVRTHIKPINGFIRFIESISEIPKCIVTSCPIDRLTIIKEEMNLETYFSFGIFETRMVPKGKPNPDIYLYAAKYNNIHPNKCIVIEDNLSGVKGGIAAGMTVIGFLAGSHLDDTFRNPMETAGAHYVLDNYEEVEKVVLNLCY